MGTARSFRTEGIVLKQTKLGEFDKIVTVFTPEHGKLRAVAKGACRPKSKLAGNVEPLTHSLLFLARGRNLNIVTQGQTVNSFLLLKSDLWSMASGLYVLELIDCFAVEGGENRALFNLLLETLNQLSEPGSNEATLRYFELRLLHLSGYRPQLRRCVSCDSPLKPTTNFLSPERGGLLCPHCNAEASQSHEQIQTTTFPSSLPLSVRALKVLRLWQRCDYATARRVKLNPDLSLEVERALHEHITYILQRELKTLTWLRELRKTGSCREESALDNSVRGD
ncbi:MAG: DNA repair protein RecO [Dehalococcoidia bacterium]